MQAICVDGGMVFGTFSFLEIRAHVDNHFIAHEYIPGVSVSANSGSEGSDGSWVIRDLTETECSSIKKRN